MIGVGTDVAAQHLLFVGQLIRLVASGDHWIGPPADPSALGEPPVSLAGVFGWLGTTAVSLQVACCVIAAGLYLVHRRRHLDPTRPAGPSRATIAIAPSISAVTAVAVLATCRLAAMRSVERVHAATAISKSADEVARAIVEVVSSLGVSVLTGVLQVILGLLVLALATSTLQLRSGIERADLLARTDERAAQAWRHVPGASIAATLVSTLVLVGALLPMIIGSGRYLFAIANDLSRFTAIESSDRMRVFVSWIDHAQSELVTMSTVSLVGIALATVFAVVTMVLLPARRRRMLCDGSAASAPPGGTAVATIVASLLISFALGRVAEPYRSENQLPIPLYDGNAVIPAPAVALPQLDGPDQLFNARRRGELVIAPILAVTPEHVTLDGRPVDAEALAEDLALLRRNASIIHPDEPTNTELILMCSPGTRLAHVIPWLRVAQTAEYVSVRIALGGWQRIQRPVFGEVQHPHFPAAAAGLGPASTPVQTERNVSLDPRDTCGALAQTVVTLRKAGAQVRLQFASATAE